MINGKIVADAVEAMVKANDVMTVTKITTDLCDTVEFLRKIAEIRKKDIADARKGY